MTRGHFAFLAVTMCDIWLAGVPRAMRQDEERNIALRAMLAIKHPHPAASCVDLFTQHNVNPPLWLYSLEEYERARQQPLLREAARMQREIEMYRQELDESGPCWNDVRLVPVDGCYGLWHCEGEGYGGTSTEDALALCERRGEP